MTALTNLDDIVNLSTGGGAGAPETLWFYKADILTGGVFPGANTATRFSSLWQLCGHPAQGSAPGGTARNPTNATAGSMLHTNPGGGRQKWLLGMQLASPGTGQTGTHYLYDRLADISGLSGIVTTAQTITGLSVSRYTSTAAVGNQIWLEIYTAVGTTATTVTASYTNEAGTAARTTLATAFGGTGLREAQRLIPLPLQAGDQGVRSVESVTLAGSTVTAGDFGVTIMRPITACVVIIAGGGGIRDLVTGTPGPVEVLSGAALFLVYLPISTAQSEEFGVLTFIEK